MKKMLRISLALAIIFILIAGIAVAGQIRDGTAPGFAQLSISASLSDLAGISPALATDQRLEGEDGVIAIGSGTKKEWPDVRVLYTQPAFTKGSSLKFMTTPWIEVTHPRVFMIAASQWTMVISNKGSSIGMSEVNHPLLCYTLREWERFPLIDTGKGQVTAPAQMASC